MAGWHHWLDGCESEWTPGVGDGQGGLACCDSWGCKESDTTERLIWSDTYIINIILYINIYTYNKYIHIYIYIYMGIYIYVYIHLGLLHCRHILYHLSHQGILYIHIHTYFIMLICICLCIDLFFFYESKFVKYIEKYFISLITIFILIKCASKISIY